MRVISASLKNFGSYESLNFNFIDQGLTLIAGPTGSGKSTLCDVIPWLAFGVTAKNGAVSEILSWPGDKTCAGALHLETRETAVIVKRSRGPKAKDNDLYYYEVGGPIVRGKDIPDTQRLLNSLLGMDADLYLAGAYYHEFSQTAQFFTTTAKNRRLICEQIVDLNLAKNLHIKLSDKYKKLNEQTLKLDYSINNLKSNINTLERVELSERLKATKWEADHELAKKQLSRLYDEFESNRDRTIHKKCRTCGTELDKPKHIHDESENPYLSRLTEAEVVVNPYAAGTKDYSDEIEAKLAEVLIKEKEFNNTNLELEDIELLKEVVADYRSTSIKRTIDTIETKTNQYLTDHFDAEIRVAFSAQDADKLEVNITKDGNACVYTQLSKGQRCMLKLCFAVAIMESVQNHHGLHFDQLFFDESLDGLSDQLKIKALKLFETISLNCGSLFLVEHSMELKTMVNNQYKVSLVDGASVIEKA